MYIGAAPGVGKTYQMLEDAHELKRQGLDVVVGFVEAHGRADTLAQIGDLEQVPLRRIEYRGVTLKEMDLDADPGAAAGRSPSSTSSRTPTRRARRIEKRYEDVLELLDAGIDVITAVNIQHLESLNDVVASTTGVRVRETVPGLGAEARRRSRQRRRLGRDAAHAAARRARSTTPRKSSRRSPISSARAT